MARSVTVEPVLFCFMLCTFMVFPLQEQLIYKKICYSKFNQTVCKDLKTDKRYSKLESIVQKETSNWMLYVNMATTFPSMVAAMILGPCSDKVGRKYILLFPLVGGIIESCALILNSYYNQWDLSVIIVGAVVSGFFGNYATILMAVFAYISDISIESSRTLRVSLLESMVFLGGAIGELLGGVLVDNAGFFIAFSLASGVHAFNLLYVIFALKESYMPPEKLKLKEAIFSCKNISSSIGLFTKHRKNNLRTNLLLLMLALFTMLMVFIGSNTVKILFVLHPPLSFSSSMIGYYLAISLLYRGIGVVAGMPILIHKLKLNDYTMTVIGCLTTLIMYTLLAFARKPWMMFVVPLIDILGGISVPCVRSIFSKLVGIEEKGTLFSAIASVEVLCSVVASVLFNNVYSATIDWHPGFCFFVMAAVLIVPISISLYLRSRDSIQSYSEFTEEEGLHEDNASTGKIPANEIQDEDNCLIINEQHPIAACTVIWNYKEGFGNR